MHLFLYLLLALILVVFARLDDVRRWMLRFMTEYIFFCVLLVLIMFVYILIPFPALFVDREEQAIVYLCASFCCMCVAVLSCSELFKLMK